MGRDKGIQATGGGGSLKTPGRERVVQIMEVSRWELWDPWSVLQDGETMGQ